MNDESISAISKIGKNISDTKIRQQELLDQTAYVDISSSPNVPTDNTGSADTPLQEVAFNKPALIERYASSFGKVLELTGVPNAHGATDIMSNKLGGLKIRAEKNNISTDLSVEKDTVTEEIAEGFSELVQKSIVYMAFWGTIKKTQTEFKRMSNGQ